MTRLLVLACLLSALVALVPAGSDDKEDVGTVIGIDLGTTYSWYVEHSRDVQCKPLFSRER